MIRSPAILLAGKTNGNVTLDADQFVQNIFHACISIFRLRTLENGSNHHSVILDTVSACLVFFSFADCRLVHFYHVVCFHMFDTAVADGRQRFDNSVEAQLSATATRVLLKSCSDIDFDCTWPGPVERSRR